MTPFKIGELASLVYTDEVFADHILSYATRRTNLARSLLRPTSIRFISTIGLRATTTVASSRTAISKSGLTERFVAVHSFQSARTEYSGEHVTYPTFCL